MILEKEGGAPVLAYTPSLSVHPWERDSPPEELRSWERRWVWMNAPLSSPES